MWVHAQEIHCQNSQIRKRKTTALKEIAEIRFLNKANIQQCMGVLQSSSWVCELVFEQACVTEVKVRPPHTVKSHLNHAPQRHSRQNWVCWVCWLYSQTSTHAVCALRWTHLGLWITITVCCYTATPFVKVRHLIQPADTYNQTFVKALPVSQWLMQSHPWQWLSLKTKFEVLGGFLCSSTRKGLHKKFHYSHLFISHCGQNHCSHVHTNQIWEVQTHSV